jgi:hypothetical protein
MHSRAYDGYRVGIEKTIKSNPRAFFGCVDLKKKRVVASFVASRRFCILKVVWHPELTL